MTEVMLGPAGFRKQQHEKRLVYDPDEPLFKKRTPAICKTLEGGVIIDLGLTNVGQQLQGLVTVESLQSDEDLAAKLESAIVALGGSKKEHKFDVLNSVLYKGADSETKRSIAYAVEDLALAD